MKLLIKFSIVIFIFLLVACHSKPQDGPVKEQVEDHVFPQGEKIGNDNFTGTAYHFPMIAADSMYQTQVGKVTFEPNARTNWHSHPGGQILLVTDGAGYYQEKGKPAQRIQTGDIVRIPPDTEHWHGASPNNELIHIAISPNMDKGRVVWSTPVSDDEYRTATN